MKYLLMLLPITLLLMGCDEDNSKQKIGKYPQEYRINFCNRLQKKLGHKVIWKDIYGEKHAMKFAAVFERYLSEDYGRWTYNCVIHTEGSAMHDEHAFGLEDRHYDNFYEIYQYLKRGLQ